MKKVDAAAVSLLMSDVKENHFTRLGLPVEAEIDIEVLNQHYFARQRQAHPDSMADKSNADLNASMQLNEAYTTLKNPLKRAEYLLLLEGIKVNVETGGVKPAPSLLMEAMEMREQLQEASTMEALKALEAEILSTKKHLFQQFIPCYNAKNFDQAAQTTISLRYTEKLLEELKAKRRAHAVT